jgi:hypothetical protein
MAIYLCFGFFCSNKIKCFGVLLHWKQIKASFEVCFVVLNGCINVTAMMVVSSEREENQ